MNEQKIAAMFDELAFRYDILNSILSARQDLRWRNNLTNWIPQINEGVLLDAATGTGEVLIAAQKKLPHYAKFIGIDTSENMLEKARNKIQQTPINKIKFQKMSATKIDLEDDCIDCVTIAFGLRNVCDKIKALQEFHRVLKHNRPLLILEFFPPNQGWGQKIFNTYFHHILPKIAGILSIRSAYEYLPRSVEEFYSEEELGQKLKESGFHTICSKHFLFGACRLIKAYAIKENYSQMTAPPKQSAPS